MSTTTLVRRAVRDLLQRSPAFRALPAAEQRAIAQNTSRAARFIVDANGATRQQNLRAELQVGDAPFVTTALTRVDFPGYVADLIQGVFGAIVDSSIQQMQAYTALLADAAASVTDFLKDSDQKARDCLTHAYPDCFERLPGGALRVRPACAHMLRAALAPSLPALHVANFRTTLMAAKMHLARQRQTLLATTILMGINRIVVTDGTIAPRITFNVIEEREGAAGNPPVINALDSSATVFLAPDGALNAAVDVTSFAALEQALLNHDAQDPALRAMLRGFFANGGKRAIVLANPADLETLNTNNSIDLLVSINLSNSDILNIVLPWCERQRCVALLHAPSGSSPAQAQEYARNFDTPWAALYYPWLRVAGFDGATLDIAASGHIAGWMTRNGMRPDLRSAVSDAGLLDVVDITTPINAAQSDTLIAARVNPIRVFPQRGLLAWGARTLSNDPEWRYISVRRYLAYLERSIEQGMQWAVFEPNRDPLWVTARSSVENFLYDEWRRGALLGAKPEHAYFVRCDRTTMTQADLDAGRLVILIGVAPVRPAEFVIFRIAILTTADA